MSRFNINCHLAYEVLKPTDFIFSLEAAVHPQQIIHSEYLHVNGNYHIERFYDPRQMNRMLRLHVPPTAYFSVEYSAEVQRSSVSRSPFAHLLAMPVAELPTEVLPYLCSSRYCPTESLMLMAKRLFADIPAGYALVNAINDWVHTEIAYVPGSTSPMTDAADVLLQRAGVCRDFAHVAISLCRCFNIPARFVVGYVEFPEPPADFHALFEAYIGGQWVLFDPTKLADPYDVVRIATGMDAVDVAFCSFYGEMKMIAMQPLVGTVSPVAMPLGVLVPT